MCSSPCNVAESKMFQLERQLEITVAGQYIKDRSREYAHGDMRKEDESMQTHGLVK